MNWKKWLGLGVLVVVGLAGYQVIKIAGALSLPSSEEELAAVRAIAEAQDYSAFYSPPPADNPPQTTNSSNNVYFGDLHVHTNMSVDAYLFGNRFDMDTAYRFAKGEELTLRTGERVRLTRPLDFVALTDHAEAFSRIELCGSDEKNAAAVSTCETLETPSLTGFLELRRNAQQRPMKMPLDLFDDDPQKERAFAGAAWRKVVDASERHNDPGRFTAFAGFEYSPVLPDRGKHHRNIIFRSDAVPRYAVSAIDAPSEIDLWKQLEQSCTGDCEFLTIPHNPNKSWGLAFASETIDGVPYTQADWSLRAKYEPIVEMFQIKGNSECSVAFGAGDEECGIEQFFPACEEGQETSCIHPTSMVRDGLRKGLALEDELGINPLKFGLIGSTDAHNSNPGDAEEWDYAGASGFSSSPAQRRMDSDNMTGIRNNNPGGLAAIWAPENTRQALFESMQRKEVYATSGTRIKLRVFAGYDLPDDIASTGDMAAAYASGVAMGGTLAARADQPLSLFVWAVQDPDNAPLARLQVIKGWIDNGEQQERVYDVACGGSALNAQTGRCEPNRAQVSLTDCRWDENAGAKELRTLWTDPDYDAEEDAFYYVRVVQNPTCRWTTYDSLKLGMEPPADSPATVTEMAWASPVWVQAKP
jgi:hypothetical protein